MGKKNNNTDKKKNAMAPSTSNPTVSADPPIEGGGAKEEEKKQESPAVAVAAVSTSSERKSRQEAVMTHDLMFTKKLDSADANPFLNRAAIVVYSDEMKKALSVSQTQDYNKIPYIRVFARDPKNREYELRFSRNDDVEQETEFILHHQWGELAADNGLEEGYTVTGYGYDQFINNQFRVFLRIQEKPPAPAAEDVFLFEKKMMDGDDLKHLAIECCSDKLKMALRRTPCIRVFATDPAGKSYEMSFAPRGREGSFTLRPGWEKIVAENGVEKGDLVTGVGRIFHDAIDMQLHLLKNVEQETTTSNPIGKTILLFEKKLESTDTGNILFGRLLSFVIRSCKDVFRKAVDQKLEGLRKKNYVRVSAIDANGRTYDLRISSYISQRENNYKVHHEWGDVVFDNGLRSGDKIWCWGSFVEDGSIQMKIDVDKELELWLSSCN